VTIGRGAKLKAGKVVEVELEARRPTTGRATDPFNGKTYLADKAKDLGLVDQVGYLHEAAAAAGSSRTSAILAWSAIPRGRASWTRWPAERPTRRPGQAFALTPKPSTPSPRRAS